jgi:hypothetical protein
LIFIIANGFDAFFICFSGIINQTGGKRNEFGARKKPARLYWQAAGVCFYILISGFLFPDANIFFPDGNFILPDAFGVFPDGLFLFPDALFFSPDEVFFFPDGVCVLPDGHFFSPDGLCDGADGKIIFCGGGLAASVFSKF